MGVIKITDKNGVIAVTQDGTPVTGAMVDEWCASWDAGRLPDGYSVEGPASVGSPSDCRHDIAPHGSMPPSLSS